jgi:hypothetical protein
MERPEARAGADARTGQKAYVQRLRPRTLNVQYWRAIGDGSQEEDWTLDRLEAALLDYLEADKEAARMGRWHFAALATPPEQSGHDFFSRVHHDREAETEKSATLFWGRGSHCSHSIKEED